MFCSWVLPSCDCLRLEERAEQLISLSRLHNDEVYERSIDSQIARLRKKIEPGAEKVGLIRTERGAGYLFTAGVEIVR
jgi:two-component system, OmpR family, response regulator